MMMPPNSNNNYSTYNNNSINASFLHNNVIRLKRVYACYYIFVLVGVIILYFYNTSVSTNNSLLIAGAPNSQLIKQFNDEMIVLNEMNDLVATVQGDDYRIMRWDATKYTQQQQQNGGCSITKLQSVFNILLYDRTTISATQLSSSSSSSSVTSSTKTSYTRATQKIRSSSNPVLSSKSYQIKSRALQYLSFCITDNPTVRKLFSEQKGIHQKVVDLVTITHPGDSKTEHEQFVTSSNPESTELDSLVFTSIMACNLIYIASFNNAKNHDEFIKAGAISVLSNIIKQPNTIATTSIIPIQIMWAAAAIQNLAASYCSTRDGRCSWDWMEDEDELVVRESNLPVTIDSTSIRDQLVQDTKLIEQLVQYTCSGPSTSTDPLPGETALLYRDEYSPNIIPWATTGAIKNIAISLTGRNYLLEKYGTKLMMCLCHLSHSRDWLEENKGYGTIYMFRRSDPCWFKDPRIEYRKISTTSNTEVCIDSIFYTKDGTTCSDYKEDPSEQDCAIQDRYGTVASKACCPCGGGTRYNTSEDDEEEDENPNNGKGTTTKQNDDEESSKDRIIQPLMIMRKTTNPIIITQTTTNTMIRKQHLRRVLITTKKRVNKKKVKMKNDVYNSFGFSVWFCSFSFTHQYLDPIRNTIYDDEERRSHRCSFADCLWDKIIKKLTTKPMQQKIFITE